VAAESTQPKNNIGGSIRLSDGTGTPVTLTLAYDRGDFQVGPWMEDLNEEVILQRRGRFLALLRGERVFPEFSFTLFGTNIIGSSTTAPGTALEFFTGKGAYAANVSTLGASRKKTVDLRLIIEGTAWGDANDEMVDLEDCVCRVTSYQEAVDGNIISISGKQLGASVVTNGSNTVTLSQAA
jgi:hypothetical protein